VPTSGIEAISGFVLTYIRPYATLLVSCTSAEKVDKLQQPKLVQKDGAIPVMIFMGSIIP